MSITSILQSSVSGLVTSQSALQVISQNIANANNPDYVRREAVVESVMAGSDVGGVGIAEIRRVAAEFLDQELLGAHSSAGNTQALSDLFNRVQDLLGDPSAETSIAALLSSAIASATELTFDPSSSTRRLDYLEELDQALQKISTLATDVQELRADTDQSINEEVALANTLIERIYELNQQISAADAQGNTGTVLKDERDAAIRELANIMEIKTLEQADGQVHVTTADGVSLATEFLTELSYQSTGVSGTNATYPPIMAYRVDKVTGEATGTGTVLDEHITGGSLAGLLAMRDEELPGLAEQLGELGAALIDEVNAVHNNSVAVPPLNTLTGINTGLLDDDALGFTGATTLAVVDSSGALVSRIDIDFDAGTLSVDGGTATSIGTTVDTFVTALDTALGANGSASFSDGVLSVSAADSTSGIGFLEPETGGSDRGGYSLSHFFGLNNLIDGTQVSNFNTGLSGTDDHGFTAGDTIEFQLSGPNGEDISDIVFTIPSGTTLDDIVTELNDTTNGLGTYITFALDSNGNLTQTPVSPYENYTLDIVTDTTERGSTGVTMTELFGMGRQHQMDQAMGLGISADILASPDNLALAQLEITGATVAGDLVATAGDGRGAQALQAIDNVVVSFEEAGSLNATTSTIGDYFALIVATQSSLAIAAENIATDSSVSLEEIETRRISVEGVNIDEELATMIIYQQAYNASARMITLASEIYDELMRVV